MLKKNILITGGSGFIGSNFIKKLVNKYPEYQVINLDCLTYAGDIANNLDIKNHQNYTFIKGNICDNKLVEQLFEDYSIEGVINFAAESHVDNSIAGPTKFMKTNIDGTFQLLEVAKKYWMEMPHEPKEGFEHSRFHHISTDEVYGTLGDKGLFSEKTPYAPSSPYSASKGSSNLIVLSYHHTFGLNVTISNSSNNYGPMQHEEKLIPIIIKKALELKDIPIYGDGKNIRDWLYVDDHCSAIDLIYHKGVAGETYNVGAENEKNNIDLTNTICNYLDKLVPRNDNKPYSDLIKFVKDRAGHDKRYAVDNSKITKDLGWQANNSFDSALLKTVKWYINKW